MPARRVREVGRGSLKRMSVIHGKVSGGWRKGANREGSGRSEENSTNLIRCHAANSSVRGERSSQPAVSFSRMNSPDLSSTRALLPTHPLAKLTPAPPSLQNPSSTYLAHVRPSMSVHGVSVAENTVTSLQVWFCTLQLQEAPGGKVLLVSSRYTS
eukprot:755594-Hanusia_phi.AAC.1